jgi:hypothetical protein
MTIKNLIFFALILKNNKKYPPMKNPTLSFALLLLAIAPMFGQKKNQNCQVREQNSKRQPIAFAQVLYDGAAAARK